MLREREWFLGILLFVYLGLLEVLSRALSEAPLCILVSEKNHINNQPDQETCSAFSEGIIRLLDLLWRHADHNAVTALATVLIAAFTFTLYRSTNRLWSAGEKQIRAMQAIAERQDLRTQDAIRLAREEFVASHRPRIILREAFSGTFLQDEPISVYLQLANVGESVGTIVRSTATVQVIGTTEMPMLHGSVEVRNDLGALRLEAGASSLIKVPGDMPKWDSERFLERDYGRGGQRHLLVRAVIHVTGQILYVDELGIARRTAFRRRLTPERQRFYKIPEEPDLDYSD